MFRSMKRRFRSLDGRFGSIYRRFCSMSGRFCSMNRRFQLTCLHCTLKIHHNNEYRETRGTLSLRRWTTGGGHFLPFLARRNHFGGGNFYGMTGLCVYMCMPACVHEYMSVSIWTCASASIHACQVLSLQRYTW